MVSFCHKNNIISDKICMFVELSRNSHFLTQLLQVIIVATRNVLKYAN